MLPCASCGEPIRPGDRFCPECGTPHAYGPATPVPLTPVPPRVRSPLVPVLIATCVVLLLVGLAGGGWVLWGRDSENGTDSAGPGAAVSGGVRPSPDGPSATQPAPTPSAPSVTTPAIPAAPLGPLHIGAAYQNQPCNGDYILMLATSGWSWEWEDKLGAAVAGVPDAKYLKGEASCEAFVARNRGHLVYAAYLGPYPSLDDACVAMSGLSTTVAWVRELANPSKERELCMCLDTAAPATIDPAIDRDDPATIRLVAQVQWVLHKLGYVPLDRTFGNYSGEFVRWVTDYQRDRGLVTDGVVGPQTWGSLRRDYCPEDRFEPLR